MKKIALINLLVFITIITVNAQWSEVNSNTKRDITDIHFVDSENGFMSCTYGTVLKTTNGGLNWQVIDTGIPVSFMSIFGIDKDTVYTSNISLYKSTNSCTSWIDYGGLGSWGAAVFDINFTSPKTGFIIKSGKLYRTNDYGLNWNKVYDNVYSNGKIIFPSRDTGYVVGGGEVMCDPVACDPPINFGSIIKTTNGGENWNKLNFFNDTLNIIAASFLDNNFGYCFSSNNTIQKTEDGGLTWTTYTTGITGYIMGGLFINKSTGFIISLNGEIYITTNGGLSWNKEYTASDQLYVIGHSNEVVVAGGNNGLICRRSLTDINGNVKKEYFNTTDVLIYPNPTSRYITIQNENNQVVQYLLTLKNTQGQEVLSEKIMLNNMYNLDLNTIKGDIYILTLSNDKEQIVRKIIIRE
jgi:photosystem II stability/assembly factor-like uncharacterized protein